MHVVEELDLVADDRPDVVDHLEGLAGIAARIEVGAVGSTDRSRDGGGRAAVSVELDADMPEAPLDVGLSPLGHFGGVSTVGVHVDGSRLA